MNKITKEKREKLTLVLGICAAIIMALHFLVISGQRNAIEDTELKIDKTRESLDKSERWRRMSGTVHANLANHRQDLDAHQENMAPLDKFKWFYNTLENFRSSYDLSLVDISREPESIEAGLLPKFPYQAAFFLVKLSGTYHEFGRFLAEFENRFPFFRVENLRLELDAEKAAEKAPGNIGNTKLTSAPTATPEKLLISLRVVTLVKPTTPL